MQSLKLVPDNLRPDCLLIEKDANTDYSIALEKLFKGDDKALDSFEDETKVMRWNNTMGSLVTFLLNLRTLGVRAIPIDQQSTDGDVREILNTRDKSMASNIKSLYDKGICKKSIYSVGTLHALDQDAGRDSKTVVHWLKDFGFTTKIIYLGISGKLSSYNPMGISKFPNQNSAFGNVVWHKNNFIQRSDLSPLLCDSILDIGAESYTFLNNKKVNVPILYFPEIENFLGMLELGLPSPNKDGFFGRMNDVDLVWIHSCREYECHQENLKTRDSLLKNNFTLY